jgi:hypothetical protein
LEIAAKNGADGQGGGNFPTFAPDDVQFWTPGRLLHSKQQKILLGKGKKLCLFRAKSGLQEED